MTATLGASGVACFSVFPKRGLTEQHHRQGSLPIYVGVFLRDSRLGYSIRWIISLEFGATVARITTSQVLHHPQKLSGASQSGGSVLYMYLICRSSCRGDFHLGRNS